MPALAEFSFEQNVKDQVWRDQARCSSNAEMVDLFFSQSIEDIVRARAFCGGCVVRAECLQAAVDNKEPWGVWGGELFLNGKIVEDKKPRGRPPASKTIPQDVIIESE